MKKKHFPSYGMWLHPGEVRLKNLNLLNIHVCWGQLPPVEPFPFFECKHIESLKESVLFLRQWMFKRLINDPCLLLPGKNWDSFIMVCDFNPVVPSVPTVKKYNPFECISILNAFIFALLFASKAQEHTIMNKCRCVYSWAKGIAKRRTWWTSGTAGRPAFHFFLYLKNKKKIHEAASSQTVFHL